MIRRIKCGNGNCFIIEETGGAVLVDTARPPHKNAILSECRRSNVKLILLTHGHVDHVQNAAYLSRELGAPIAMHEADHELLANNAARPLYAESLLGKVILSLSKQAFEREIIEQFKPSHYISDGDTLHDYGVNARVIALPGHTRGSIGIIAGDDIIVGDALMNMAYPSKSPLYEDKAQMLHSAEIISNSGSKTVHFGHGKSLPNRKW